MTTEERDLAELGRQLRAAMEKRGWGERALAAQAGVSHGTIGNILAGRNKSKAGDHAWRPREDGVRKLAEALGMDPVPWLRLAGYHVPETVEQERLLRQINDGVVRLSPDEQRVFADMITGMLVSRGLVAPPNNTPVGGARELPAPGPSEDAITGVRSGVAEVGGGASSGDRLGEPESR